MSFKPSLWQTDGWPIHKVAFAVLLLLHSIWIIVHMNLVSRELINPWKLGGYGMYTTASPRPKLQLFDMRFGPTPMDWNAYNADGFTQENHRFAFRCAQFSEASMQKFFNENSLLVGMPIQFVIWERRLLREPIRIEGAAHSLLAIRWTGADTFRYAGQVCGKTYDGQIKFQQQG
ncbi:MAG: hypothetical protein AAF299_04450 [Pseudomonadota bacterium]